MATGRELPINFQCSTDSEEGTGFIWDEPGEFGVFVNEYGLTKFQLRRLAGAGDDAIDDPEHFKNSTTVWPEAEIVQALLDKVDELEAQEASSHAIYRATQQPETREVQP